LARETRQAFRSLAVHVAAWLVWVAVLWWFWMLLVGEWTPTEVIAASCAAAPIAAVAELLRAKGVGSLRVPLRRLTAAKGVPLMIPVDFAIITWALVRAAARGERVGGSFRVKPFAEPEGAVRAQAARAWTTLAACYSPNAYVIDIDPEAGIVLLHDLVPHAPSEEPA
jgi:hypothetical protein